MNKPSTFTTPSGDRMVVIPFTEYERLTEAAKTASDICAYDEAKRLLAAGEEELIPAEVVNRILAGENKVRVWREYRGMSVKALAESCKLTPAYLSQIETGKREGSVQVFKKIAGTLRVDIDDIV
jgi:DNA-binding XRE family transcriptional regulator